MAPSLRVACVLCIPFGACRIEPDASLSAAPAEAVPETATPPDEGDTGASGGRGGSASARGGSGGVSAAGGSRAEANGGAGGGQSASDPDEGSAGADDTAVVYCDAQPVSFDELRGGEVRAGAHMSLEAIVTSQKFLLSHASSGSCLFAAYVGAEPVDGEPRGLLVVSYGDDAPEDFPCQPGTDGIPDDLVPGDHVVVAGRFSTYVPSSCDGTVPSPQLLVNAECPLSVSGHGGAPAAVTLSFAQADALALGTDDELLRHFAASLVRIENVSGLPDEEGTDVVGPFGVIRLAETRLTLTNDIGYGDLTLSGPGDPQKSLRFGYPTRFVSVTGVVHLDYCAWSLAPRSGCTDIDPASEGCD